MRRSPVTAIPFLIVLYLLISYVPVHALNWYAPGWQYRKAMIINADKVTADLTGFPLLANVTDADLASYAQTDGDDILFTGNDGTTRLDHEIESYGGGSGTLVAFQPAVRSLGVISDRQVSASFMALTLYDPRILENCLFGQPTPKMTVYCKEVYTMTHKLVIRIRILPANPFYSEVDAGRVGRCLDYDFNDCLMDYDCDWNDWVMGYDYDWNDYMRTMI